MKIIEVWDLPLRLFHWSLVILVTLSLVTGLLGDIDSMDIHMLSGYGVLTLLLFRIAWGFAGGRYARFSSFLRSPAAAFRYLRSVASEAHTPTVGHNPAAGWMVAALLLALLVQGSTGLFATDDIFVEGPLTHLVSSDASGKLTSIHHFNYRVVAGLIILHLVAVIFYHLIKRVNLTLPMITGKKQVDDAVADSTGTGTGWRAVPFILLSAIGVYAVVEWL